MIAPNERLSREDVRQKVAQAIESQGWFKRAGYKCTGQKAIDALVEAAVTGETLENVCQDLALGLTSNGLRSYLNQQLTVDELRAQEMTVNQSLSELLPEALPRQKCAMALDYHDEPFYGKMAETVSYACRGKAQVGTTHFYRVASLYVMWGPVHLTVAISYVLPEDSTVQVVQRLLERMSHLRLRPSVLYLDKGFCSTAVIGYLQQARVPALLACPIRGKQGGIRALCRGRAAFVTPYTFTDQTTVQLVLLPTRPPGKSGHPGCKWIAYVRIGLDWSPAKCFRHYHRRFAIESSYRQFRQLRAKTTSLNPALRFFLIGLAFLLLNCWVACRFFATRLVERGPLHLDEPLFRLPRFIAFLRPAIEARYPTTDAIPIWSP